MRGVWRHPPFQFPAFFSYFVRVVRQGKVVATFRGQHTIHDVHQRLPNAFKSARGVVLECLLDVRQNVKQITTLIDAGHSSLKGVDETQVQHLQLRRVRWMLFKPDVEAI